MEHAASPETLVFHRDPGRHGYAAVQFEAAIAAIVEKACAQAVEEDRRKWGRGAAHEVIASASKDGLEECPRCRGRGSSCTLCSGCGIMFTEVVTHGGREPEPATSAPPPTPSDPPPVATMPAFPMSKQVEHDRVVLVREPRETGSAWQQFERTLKGYLERHAPYREVERVVYQDRPCPRCPCPKCSEGRDDDGWDDDGWDEDDEDGDEDDRTKAEGNPAADRPPVPPALPSVRSRLADALERTLADAAIEDAARMLAGPFANGDIETIAFVLAVLGEMDEDEEGPRP